jgi:hypothetical protein
MASLRHSPVAPDPFPDPISVFCGIVQGDADEPGMQIRLGGQDTDPSLLAALQFLKARDDLPHIRACGKSRPAVMSRAPEDDPRIVELVDSLDDELIQQRRGGRALASGT